jgi:hypothetical protein
VEVTNGSINVELPESLARLLIAAGDDWHEGSSDVVEDGEPAPADVAIPLTYIPGVVPVSMARVRKLVASGKVPVTTEGRTKLVRPSDVRAALGL